MGYDTLLEKYRPQLISNLQDMVRIRSVGSTPWKEALREGVHQALNLALETASDLGFRAVNRDGMMVTPSTAREGDGGRPRHLDVVPEGKGWTYPPFGAEIHDGKMYGRGTTDDKGPTVAALWARKILSDEGHRLSRRIRIIFGTNEESGFRGIKWYAANEEAPVAGFTPDIPEGIVHAEKGGLHIRIDVPVGVNDATRLVSFRAGEAVNIVPDRCEAVFAGDPRALDDWAKVLRGAVGAMPQGGEVLFEKGALTVRAFGKAAHASLPEKGENAIAALCRLIDSTPPLGGPSRPSRSYRAAGRPEVRFQPGDSHER